MRFNDERGMTLIELMIAMTVLTVGMGAMIVVFAGAIAGNSKAKMDTTATMLAQTVLERIANQSTTGIATPALTITDCNQNAWTIATSATAAGVGANLNGSSIDYTQAYAAVPNNYKMLFVSCGAANRTVTYDVRWNIQQVGPSGYTRLITVAARPSAAANAGNMTQALMYAQPITLRGIGGI